MDALACKNTAVASNVAEIQKAAAVSRRLLELKAMIGGKHEW